MAVCARVCVRVRVCVCVCVSVVADDLITMVGVVVFVLDKYVYGGKGVEGGGGGGGGIVDRGSWWGDVRSSLAGT